MQSKALRKNNLIQCIFRTLPTDPASVEAVTEGYCIMNQTPILFVVVAVALGTQPAFPADEFERAPIRYSQSAPENCVSRLQARIDRGEAQLAYDERHGYVPSVLEALGVSTKSQMLVFSKTSLQRQRIAPETPRALYFNDDVYVGFCRYGEVVEISAVDPVLGAVFYTLDQEPVDRPKFVRQTDNCLICHGSSQTRGIPGHLVRSVFSDAGGQPILSSGTYRVDHSTPLAHRWGGWYVTGRHGEQTHLGNLIIRGKRVPDPVDNAQGQNVTDLDGRFDVNACLTPHSDIVALMVLEHQATAHNLITDAGFTTRQAIDHERQLNRELHEPAQRRWESTTSRIKSVGDALARYLLFAEEARLTAPIAGTSGFTEEFSKRGPRDRRGRSLRDFDLERRLFKYPCSYLVYSAAFDALPAEVREHVWRRVWDVLTGRDASPDYAHLTTADRTAILEILRDTKPGLPDYWHATKNTK